MKHSDFQIGTEFLTESGRWRCTDVGTRTIVAIKLEEEDEPAWYGGLPFGVLEHVFDEYDIEDCHSAPPRTPQRDYRAAGEIAIPARKPRGRR